MSLAIDNRNSNKKVSNKNNSSETTKYPAESYASKDFLQSYQLKANSSKKQTQLAVLQKKANNTGLPENVKNNTESISGISLDDVKVNYNSNKPAQLNAHAYAEGSNIHVAPGQEKHIGHEAWHVVQQKQGRVKPTTEVGGIPINDNKSLESEADKMGQQTSKEDTSKNKVQLKEKSKGNSVAQLAIESQEAMTGGLTIAQRKAKLALAGLTDGPKILKKAGIFNEEEAQEAEKSVSDNAAEEAAEEAAVAEQEASNEILQDGEDSVQENEGSEISEPVPSVPEKPKDTPELKTPDVQTIIDHTDDKGNINVGEVTINKKKAGSTEQTAAMIKSGPEFKEEAKNIQTSLLTIKTAIEDNNINNTKKNLDEMGEGTNKTVESVAGPLAGKLFFLWTKLGAPILAMKKARDSYKAKKAQRQVFKDAADVTGEREGSMKDVNSLEPSNFKKIIDYAINKVWKGIATQVAKGAYNLAKLINNFLMIFPSPAEAFAACVATAMKIVDGVVAAGSLLKKAYQFFRGQNKDKNANTLLNLVYKGDKKAEMLLFKLDIYKQIKKDAPGEPEPSTPDELGTLLRKYNSGKTKKKIINYLAVSMTGVGV